MIDNAERKKPVTTEFFHHSARNHHNNMAVIVFRCKLLLRLSTGEFLYRTRRRVFDKIAAFPEAIP